MAATSAAVKLRQVNEAAALLEVIVELLNNRLLGVWLLKLLALKDDNELLGPEGK